MPPGLLDRMTSLGRVLLVGIPTLLLARLPGFELRWIWYRSASSMAFQLAMNPPLLRREFRIRLQFGATAAA